MIAAAMLVAVTLSSNHAYAASACRTRLAGRGMVSTRSIGLDGATTVLVCHLRTEQSQPPSRLMVLLKRGANVEVIGKAGPIHREPVWDDEGDYYLTEMPIQVLGNAEGGLIWTFRRRRDESGEVGVHHTSDSVFLLDRSGNHLRIELDGWSSADGGDFETHDYSVSVASGSIIISERVESGGYDLNDAFSSSARIETSRLDGTTKMPISSVAIPSKGP